MFKKINIILCFLLLVSFSKPFFASAAGEFQVIEVYDPQNLISTPLHYNPDYHGMDVVLVYFRGTSIKKLWVSNYADSSFSTPLNPKTRTAADYGWSYFNGFYFSCNRYYKAEFFGATDNLLIRIKIHVTGLVNPSCDSSSYGNYDDMGGSDSNTCNACDLFSCPGWDQYLGKLTEIKNAIPPAPNWNQVATVFRDTIVPQLVSDIGTLLGPAPSVPNEPAELSDLDTRGIENKVPSMPDSGLDTSGFTKGRIESEAPVIEERADPTGGWDISDPLGTLPDFPSMPIPGETDPKGWDAGKPKETETQLPIPKDQDSTPDTGTAPTPSQNNDTPPSPGDNGGNAPVPNQDDSIQGSKYYKKHPDDPDGSGGE
ncbi:hypothetical protein NSR01_10175 [Anoxybacillus sp. FSL W8-0703]|uniref:hypothetical protein n=1 Tax=Anoxybacillus sp. FSL W8-0703 TaxID=2954704 RepID=UPI0030F65185